MGGSVATFFDLALKFAISAALPLCTLLINNRIADQTRAIEQQKQLFAQSMQVRDKDVELTIKFYDIINSRRFECFEGQEAPLLSVIIQQHNAHNGVKIDEAQIIDSLVKQSLHSPACRANHDSELVRSAQGRVPFATSTQASSKPNATAAESASGTDNALIKQAQQTVSQALQRQPTSAGAAPNGPSQPVPGADGWAAVGRYSAALGFTNFTVLGRDAGKIDPHGNIEPDTILRTRWSVFLRLSNEDTTQGGNPVLGVLSESTCVRVKKSVAELRGQTWAAVALEPTFPESNYVNGARQEAAAPESAPAGPPG